MSGPARPAWLEVTQGTAPLIVCFPHTGADIPPEIETRLVSPWLGRKDTDWWIDQLYDFAGDLRATTIRTTISRTVIDVNRDPSGVSLYPGQATTTLCPTFTFDGEPLYRAGAEPDAAEIAERRAAYFQPYHAAIEAEIARLKGLHGGVVLYDAHAIRSTIPRLFDGQLPQFNIGANNGQSCAAALVDAAAKICSDSGFSSVVDGRFKGGYTTRYYGQPHTHIHALQMELACRGYMAEPDGPASPQNWPPPYAPGPAAPLRDVLLQVLRACLVFAKDC